MKRFLILSSLMLLAACASAKLPDPTVEYPFPPPALMEPARTMTPIGEPRF